MNSKPPTTGILGQIAYASQKKYDFSGFLVATA
jgi:hypothetical protein